MNNSNNRILIVTAVEAEREAVLRGLDQSTGQDGRDGSTAFSSPMTIDVITVGVGPAWSAAGTTVALMKHDYDLVISCGIAGGFVGRADVGTIVVADRIVAADLGAETQDGFHSLEKLGFGDIHIQASEVWNKKLIRTLEEVGLTVLLAPILSVSTATGTANTAQLRAASTPGAGAEGMEGYGVAVAAQQQGVPMIEIRTISNAVGPRNRAAWRIPEALQQLESVAAVIHKLAEATEEKS